MWIERDRAPIHVLRRIERLPAALVKELPAAKIVFVGANALRRDLLDRGFFVRSQNELESVDDVGRDLILNLENVFHLSVVSFRPEVVACRNVDELSRDAESLACFANASFEHRAHVELAAYLAHVFGALLEPEGRAA